MNLAFKCLLYLLKESLFAFELIKVRCHFVIVAKEGVLFTKFFLMFIQDLSLFINS